MAIHEPPPPVFGEAPSDVECRDRYAAYAVIRNANSLVAVVQFRVGGRDHFWLPGGGMHDAESPEETIIREVKEELGRQVQVHRDLGQVIQFFYASDRKCWYRMTAHFLSAELRGEPDGSGEFDLHWVNAAERREEFFHACHVWAAVEADA